MKKIGICFSRKFEGTKPLDHMESKLPVYLRFLELCQEKGWQVFILTKKEYLEQGQFAKSWLFENGKFTQYKKPVKIDLIFDRTGGTKFPPDKDRKTIFVNNKKFKVLCWRKFITYQILKEFMPKTVWVGEKEGLERALAEISIDKIALKPHNGLGGLGIFIGSKKDALNFEFPEKYKEYIAQEFIDTSCGIEGLVNGIHDLRTVIVNNKIVWAHIRTPQKGSLMCNVGQGGNIQEINVLKIPSDVINIVNKVRAIFYQNYDNPIYSLDFGMTKNGPKIFEVNDQIGFPKWEMENRDKFLNELVENFADKLNK